MSANPRPPKKPSAKRSAKRSAKLAASKGKLGGDKLREGAAKASAKRPARKPAAGSPEARRAPKGARAGEGYDCGVNGCYGIRKEDGEHCPFKPVERGTPYEADPSVKASGWYCQKHAAEYGEAPVSPQLERWMDEHGGRAPDVYKKQTPAELIQAIVKPRAHLIIKPHLDALGLRIGVDENGDACLEKDPDNVGAVLHGTFEGEVIASSHPDVEAQQRAAERLMDRGFGKAVQTNLLGQDPNTGPVEVDVPTTAERIQEVAEVLKELGLE